MKAICLDSSGWIEIAEGGSNAQAFAEALISGTPLIVSTIHFYEIAKYVTREAGAAAADELMAFIGQYTIANITVDLALSAAALSARYKLAMADALIYATAIAHDATLWTQDEDFKELPNVRYFPKVKP
jgi:toxin FitB